ncbi:MAG TPA: thiamine pyrophosphate-dependent enzyme [Candidatus Tectomicrobia bacterium]|nr:thiamine pyrophosphate-dependent enzyme [Candidatus Tectomicrobia bacterium]
MVQMTGGQAVVQALRREGVEYVFGLPGVQIMGIYDAFYGQSEVKLITVRHEQTTTYMADGYARVTGKPGVGLVVPGPGVQNASAALGTAYSCSSPVLLIAGQIESHMLGQDKGALHEINDQLDIVRPVTKWCQRVLNVEEIPGAIHEAMRQMQTGRPRPTLVEIPPDVLATTAEVSLPGTERYATLSPDEALIRRAAELLATAKKPLIWAGGGAIVGEASAELQALAEALGAPVATTPEGKGAIPEDHPLALGVGYYGHGAPSLAAPRADVLLAVGTRLTGQMRGPTAPRAPQRLIHLDVDASVIGKNYPADVALVGHAKPALQMLLEAVRAQKVSHERWPPQELAEIIRDTNAWLRQQAPLQYDIIGQLQSVLRDDAVVVSGITNVGYWSHFALRVRRPRTYVGASYFATLGFAFPTALGAKVAAPDRQVVSLSGDGGFMYALSELATAVQYGINVVALVFADGAFGASNNDQRTRFHGRIVGTNIHNPNFVQVAEAFGARGIRAEPDKLAPALREAFDAGRPTLIEVPVPTMVPPFQIPPRVE